MITFDFETRSKADLRNVGQWVYSLHPSTDIICCAYGIGAEEIETWWDGRRLGVRDKKLTQPQMWGRRGKAVSSIYKYKDTMPFDLCEAIADGEEVEAHNVAFERSIWQNVMLKLYGWILPDDDQWRDTMAVANYMSMPPSLDKLAEALGYEGKNKDGAQLIAKYSKLHNKNAKLHIPDHEWTRWGKMTAKEKEEFPEAKEAGGFYREDFMKFVNYCVDDVKLEQAVSDELGDLPEAELEVFLLDQKINMHGVYLDEESINSAIGIVNKRADELASRFKEITGFAPTQTDRIHEWFEAQGWKLENLQAEYLGEVIAGGHGEEINDPEWADVKEALQLRLKHAKASVKKLNKMLVQRDPFDGRARYQSKYHGAGTGRWTGGGIQLLNMNRGFEDINPNTIIRAINVGSPKLMDVMYGDAMDAVGKASRHHLKAPIGKHYKCGDYSSIEAIVLACLAGEEWKIEAFERKDPIYELMGCKIHKLGDEAEELARSNKAAFKKQYPDERQDGKTGELAFGYQGGLGAWRNFDKSDKHSDDRVNEIKDMWRDEHPAIAGEREEGRNYRSGGLWKELGEAAIKAVADPGREFYTRACSYKVIDEWLACTLINGKRIWYFDPQLRMGWPAWHKPGAYDPDKPDKNVEYADCHFGICDCEKQLQLTYMAQKEGRWGRVSTYGGKLCENITQATSREILVPAMKRLDKAGYSIILTVYDEILSEDKDGFGSLQEFKDIMSDSPGQWAYFNGRPWPISVDAWQGTRYKK